MRLNLVLILASFLLTLYAWGQDPSFITRNLAFSTANLIQGRYWTLITALLVHANLAHLLGNMLFLYVFGGTIESEVGSGGLAIAFFSGGVFSFLFSAFYYPASALIVGASAAIFTLASVAMLVKPLKFSWLLLMPVGLAAILYAFYNVAAIHYGIQSKVAFPLHIAGFIVGLPFGIKWSPRWKTNLAISIGLLALYFILVALASYLFPGFAQALV